MANSKVQAKLCIVSTNFDLVILKVASCESCAEKKLHLSILQTIVITERSAKEFIDLGIKAYHPKCTCVSL